MSMSEDKRATEDKNVKIDVIQGSEALGYEGSGREEHSGEKKERVNETATSGLADNKPEQM